MESNDVPTGTATAHSQHQKPGGHEARLVTGSKELEQMTKNLKTFKEAFSDSNEFLVFTGTIAIFMASVNVSLLSFTHDKISDRTVPERDNTSVQEVEGLSKSDQVAYSCFILSTILSITPGAFAWTTHGFSLRMLSKEGNAATNETAEAGEIQQVESEFRSGRSSRIWISRFLIPAAILMWIGMIAFVWGNFPKGIVVVSTMGLAYCVAHIIWIAQSLSQLTVTSK